MAPSIGECCELKARKVQGAAVEDAGNLFIVIMVFAFIMVFVSTVFARQEFNKTYFTTLSVNRNSCIDVGSHAGLVQFGIAMSEGT